jgi:hypothetical protein
MSHTRGNVNIKVDMGKSTTSLENKESRMEQPGGNILYTSKLNDYTLCGDTDDDTIIFSGQLASFEDKVIQKAA